MTRSCFNTSRRELIVGAGFAAVALGLGRPIPASNPSPAILAHRQFTTPRHRTAYLEIGPADGPLMIFLHGWPHLGLVWQQQLAYFAGAGWRCIAPDMRGYGDSSVPTRIADYGIREAVADMIELHNSLGGTPAIWVGHSLGCTVVWGMATHHAERCRGVINLTVPHFARGNSLPTLIPLIDRTIYPIDRYPLGQWDYMAFCDEHFTKAVRDFETHAGLVLDMFYSRSSPDAVGKPTPLASIREQGGWFPPGSKAPSIDTTRTLLAPGDRKVMLAAFARNGFSGPCAWYLNDQANMAYAAGAPRYGRIALPVLFLGGQWDTVCDAAFGRLAEPMREDCANLTEVNIAAGHMLMLERPEVVHRQVSDWLAANRLKASA